MSPRQIYRGTRHTLGSSAALQPSGAAGYGSTAASQASSQPHSIASWREHEVVLDFPECAGKAELPRSFRIIHALETSEQALLHPEHRIRADIGIIGVEDVCDERLIAVCLQDEMQVRRAVGWSSQLPQQLSHRPTLADRIVLWLHCPEPVVSVRPRAKQATQVEIRLDAFLLNGLRDL